MKRTRKTRPLAERFWEKVDKEGPEHPDLGRCWLWVGSLNPGGYGQISQGRGHVERAHRIAYRLCVGDIPEGKDLRHLCHNRACVNPVHLQPSSRRETVREGESPSSRFAKRTHCAKGHLLDEENTLVVKNARICRTCKRGREAAWRKTHPYKRKGRSPWTEERRMAHSARMKEVAARPEARAKRSARMKEYWADDVKAARHREALRAASANQENRNRLIEAMNRPEVKAKLSAASKDHWAKKSPEERQAHIQRMHKGVKGGKYVSSLEAKVMSHLTNHRVPYLVHSPEAGYVLDLFVPSHDIDIECDGPYFHSPDSGDRETLRDLFLEARGITVLRLTAEEIETSNFARLDKILGIATNHLPRR